MSKTFDKYIETLISSAKTFLTQNRVEIKKDLDKIYEHLYRKGDKEVVSDDFGNGTLEVYIPEYFTIDEGFLYKEFQYNETDWNKIYFYDSNIPEDAFYCLYNSIEILFIWSIDSSYIRIPNGEKAILVNRENKEIYWEIAITNILNAINRSISQI